MFYGEYFVVTSLIVLSRHRIAGNNIVVYVDYYS